MPSLVADTHAIIWYLLKTPRISATALRRMDEAIAAGDTVRIPSICLVEMAYLQEKGRIPEQALRLLDETDGDSSSFLPFPQQ